MHKKYFGQQAIEFILVSSLILLGSLATMLAFGGKISNFFSNDSAIAQTSKLGVAKVTSSSEISYGQNYSTLQNTTNSIFTDTSLSQYNVIQNSDGSVSFTVNSQTVNLPVGVLQLQDTVMQSTASSGSTELIKDIAETITTYKAEYSSTTVPLSLSFGLGKRQNAQDSSTATYIGTTKANSVSIKTGNHLTIIQNDQQCMGSVCAYSGLYKIQGSLNNSNKLDKVKVSAKLRDGSNFHGTFSGSVDVSNGIKISSAGFQFDNTDWSYNWDIDCSSTDKQFNL